MKLLKLSSPLKHAVAESLYYTAAGEVGEPVLEADYALKQSLLVALAPEIGPEAVATPVGKDPLLAQCFGNRSATLYEMKLYNASCFLHTVY